MTQKPMSRKDRSAAAKRRHQPGARTVRRAKQRYCRDGRPDSLSINDRFAMLTLIDHLPYFKQMAAAVATTPRTRRGRKRDYPAWVFALTQAAVHTGSQRQAITAIADYWPLIRRAARDAFPDDPALPKLPPARYHWRYWLKTCLTPNVEQQHDEFTRIGGELARQIGLLDPDEPFSTHPQRSQVISADVKYYDTPSNHTPATALYVDEITGEVKQHRVDPASRSGKKGGDTELSWGSPIMTVSVRNDSYRQRIILHLGHMELGEGEGQHLLNAIDRLDEFLLRPHAVCYDGALHGTHIDAIMRRGMLAVSPVTAHTSGKNGSHSKTGRVEKNRRIGHIACGVRGHDLFGIGGHIAANGLTDKGNKPQNLGFSLTRQERTSKVSGTYYDFYMTARIPCKHGEKEAYGQRFHEHREPLTAQLDDAEKRFNRSEHLRQLPPGSPGYCDIYPYRSDTESGHSLVDRTFWGGIVPAYGKPRQLAMMIGYAITENLMAARLARENADAPPKPSRRRPPA